MINKTLFQLIITLIVLVTLQGCSPKLSNVVKEKPLVFYPENIETAKIQYLTSYGSSNDIEPKVNKFRASIVGAQPIKSIAKPYGVYINDGKIFTAGVSAGNISIVDLKQKKLNQIYLKGRGRLDLGLNIFVDSKNQINVADASAGCIKMYTIDGEYVGKWGVENIKPTDLVIKDGKIWVCDASNHRVNIYDEATHKFIDYFPKVENKDIGWLYTPTNIFVTSNNVYVSDMGANCISVYDRKGEFIKQIGSIGNRPGQFTRPKGVAVDNENNIYAVDGAFQNIQIFNKEGQLLMYFGGSEGSVGNGGMNMPTGVFIDYDNNEYFEKYVDPSKKLIHIILVSNQFGPDKISVYGRIEPKN